MTLGEKFIERLKAMDDPNDFARRFSALSCEEVRALFAGAKDVVDGRVRALADVRRDLGVSE